MQRKEAQQRDAAGKKRELMKKREREKEEEMAKAIAQAKLEHSQRSDESQSNRSSIRSSSIDDEGSHRFSETDRNDFSLERERERLLAEKLEKEKAARDALQNEREQQEKKEKEKSALKEKSSKEGKEGKEGDDVKRSEILAQREAKLLKRKSHAAARSSIAGKGSEIMYDTPPSID